MARGAAGPPDAGKEGNTMKMRKIILISALIIGWPAASGWLAAGQEPPEFSLEKVAGDVYCLYGAGGNIGVLRTDKGFLVVDAQYARSAETALGKIRELGEAPILSLINTHYHGDHTGGNSILGHGAEIVAHVNCRASFLKGLKPEESPESMGAPDKTYESEMTLEMGEERIRLLHFGPGHTAGDTVVVFERARVIHTGDLFFNGLPPYIDVEDGSSTENWVRTIGLLAERYPDFKLIPGHGRVAGMPEWVAFAEYLRSLRALVAAAVKAGKTREETVASIDLARFADIRDQGEFLTKSNNAAWIYDEMTRK